MQMSDRKRPATIHPLSNGDLRAGRVLDGFEDPSGLTAIAPEKRSALLSNPVLGGTTSRRGCSRRSTPSWSAGSTCWPTRSTPRTARAHVLGLLALRLARGARQRCRGGSLLRGRRGEPLEAAGVCAPSRLSHPLYVQRGYLDLPLTRSILVRHARPIVDQLLGGGAAGRVGGAVAEAASAAHRALLSAGRRGAPHPTRFGAVRRVPARARTPAASDAGAPFAIRRSAAWLDWVVQESFVVTRPIAARSTSSARPQVASPSRTSSSRPGSTRA